MKKYDLLERQPIQEDHDYADVPNVATTSANKSAVLHYIAGYVVRMVKKRITCPVCVEALEAGTDATLHHLLGQKNRGGLVKPSESVVLGCQETEKYVLFILYYIGQWVRRCTKISRGHASVNTR